MPVNQISRFKPLFDGLSYPINKKGRDFMKKLGKILLVGLAVCLFLCAVLYSMYLDAKYKVDPPGAARGSPVRFEYKASTGSYRLHQVVNDNDHMYLLYGYNGVLEVYSLDGTYQYAYSLYADMNGRFIEKYNGVSLYLFDMHGNVYVFEKGVFIKYLPREEALPIRTAVSTLGDSTRFKIRSGSVWEGDTCLISRPSARASSVVYLMVIVVVFIRFFPKKRKLGG